MSMFSRMPWTDARSLMRAMWTCSTTGCSSARPESGAENTSATARTRRRKVVAGEPMMASKGQKLYKRTNDDVGLAGAISNSALAFDLDFQFGDRCGDHG